VSVERDAKLFDEGVVAAGVRDEDVGYDD